LCHQQKFCSRVCRIRHNNPEAQGGDQARSGSAAGSRRAAPLYVPTDREDDWLKDQLAVPKMPWEREVAPG
jgi:hypothetical protein